ncbi:MAG: hypothetical protein H7240_06185 [Glaciimonas sp.]|nr:hypothetical protein [Glaciimonas sp.]
MQINPHLFNIRIPINMPDANAGNLTGGPARLPAFDIALNAPTPGNGNPEVEFTSALAQQAANVGNYRAIQPTRPKSTNIIYF